MRSEFENYFRNTLFYSNMLASAAESGVAIKPFEKFKGQYRNTYVQLAYSVYSHQQSKVDELHQQLESEREETIKGYTKISDLRLERDELQREKLALTNSYADAQNLAIKYRCERDELRKENEALVHVIKSRDIQIENEKHEYDELMNKLVDSGMKNNELQKRVDVALLEIKGAARWVNEDAIDDPDFIKGGVLRAFARLEQALKGGEA